MIVTLFFCKTAFAWEPKKVNGEIVTWNSSEISFYLNTDKTPLSETDTETAIIKSADIWGTSSTESNFTFIYQGITKKNSADLSDGEHVVSFDTSWNQDPSLLAITHVWSNSNGDITHFDIEVNVDGIDWTTTGELGKHDLQNSLAHEFGHALGLEHSSQSDATMFASTSAEETSKRDLSLDDIEGLETLYPKNGTTPDTTTEEINEETTSSSESGGPISNHVDGPSNTGSDSLGPVQLDRAGCSYSSTSSLLWLFACFLFPHRKIM